ncbi:MAG: hypothetical protein ACR2P8_12255, partial [Myxococcota bacterium]
YYVSFRSDQFRTTGQGFAWALSGDVPENLTGLTASDFQRVEPAGPGFDGELFPGEQPDFSSSGGRIRVGFAPGTSTSDLYGRRSVFRMNDFRLVVQRGPTEVPSLLPPALWTLGALLVVSGVGLTRGRSRRRGEHSRREPR